MNRFMDKVVVSFVLLSFVLMSRYFLTGAIIVAILAPHANELLDDHHAIAQRLAWRLRRIAMWLDDYAHPIVKTAQPEPKPEPPWPTYEDPFDGLLIFEEEPANGKHPLDDYDGHLTAAK